MLSTTNVEHTPQIEKWFSPMWSVVYTDHCRPLVMSVVRYLEAARVSAQVSRSRRACLRLGRWFGSNNPEHVVVVARDKLGHHTLGLSGMTHALRGPEAAEMPLKTCSDPESRDTSGKTASVRSTRRSPTSWK